MCYDILLNSRCKHTQAINKFEYLSQEINISGHNSLGLYLIVQITMSVWKGEICTQMLRLMSFNL